MSDGARPRPTMSVVSVAAPITAAIDSGRAAGAFRTRSHAAIASTDATRPRATTRPSARPSRVAVSGMTLASHAAVSAASSTKKIAASPRRNLADIRSDRRNRDHAQGAAAAAHELERRRNDHRARRRQLIEMAQAGQTELSGAVHDGVVRERWVECARLTRIRADRFDADTQHVTVMREHTRRIGVEARAVGAVSSGVDARRTLRPATPSRSQHNTRAAGHATVRALPGLELTVREEKVRILRDLRGHVDHAGWADELLRRNRIGRVVGQILSRHPVHGGVEVRAGMFAKPHRIPVPGWTPGVIP